MQVKQSAPARRAEETRMSKKQAPRALGLVSVKDGKDTSTLRHNNGRFARNHAQPTKYAYVPGTTPANPLTSGELVKEAAKDPAVLEMQARLLAADSGLPLTSAEAVLADRFAASELYQKMLKKKH